MTASRSNQRRQRAPSKSPSPVVELRHILAGLIDGRLIGRYGNDGWFGDGRPSHGECCNPWKCNDESYELQSWLKAHNIDFNEICKHNKDSGKFQRMVSVVHTNETENVLDKEILNILDETWWSADGLTVVEQAAEIAQTRESMRLADNLVEAMVAYLAGVRQLPSSEQMPPTTVAPEDVRLSVQIPDIQSLGGQSQGSFQDTQDHQALRSSRGQLPPITVPHEGVRISIQIPGIQSPGGQSHVLRSSREQ
uniref:Uncharacterized protein n=1 Tax=Timema genevievae TaxID=629358 RepID=A0A7R9PRR5_TIMGE|nr:unnamed protein product [Timema genevievae]